MRKIDEFVIVSLLLTSAFIIINHLVFGLFGDTAVSFAKLCPVWIFMYGMIVMSWRGEL